MRFFLERMAGRVLFALPAPVHTLLCGGRSIRLDGQRLDPALQLMLVLLCVKGGRGLHRLSPEDARAATRRDARMLPGRAVSMAAVVDLEIDGASGPLAARHYVPQLRAGAPVGPLPLLVFFHGGGWVMCDLDTHDIPCRALADAGQMQVLSVEYRLAPEHPYPAAREDALAAFRWARDHANALGADPSLVAVGGDSAGGNLAAHVAQDAAEDGGAGPAAQLLIYPSVDLDEDGVWPSYELFADRFFLTTDEMHWFSVQYVGVPHTESGSLVVPPMRTGRLGGIAPALIVTAGFDPLRDEGEAYAEMLEEAGTKATVVRYPDMLHGFLNMTGISAAAQRAVTDVGMSFGHMLTALRQG